MQHLVRKKGIEFLTLSIHFLVHYAAFIFISASVNVYVNINSKMFMYTSSPSSSSSSMTTTTITYFSHLKPDHRIQFSIIPRTHFKGKINPNKPSRNSQLNEPVMLRLLLSRSAWIKLMDSGISA